MVQRHPAGRPRVKLLGRTVLLIADQFEEARDTQQALQHAGASVIGPFGNSVSALRCIVDQDLSCAVLDLDLRDERRFIIASALKDKEVPMIFVSSANASEISQEFSEAPVLVKPVDFHSLLTLTGHLISKASTRQVAASGRERIRWKAM